MHSVIVLFVWYLDSHSDITLSTQPRFTVEVSTPHVTMLIDTGYNYIRQVYVIVVIVYSTLNALNILNSCVIGNFAVKDGTSLVNRF